MNSSGILDSMLQLIAWHVPRNDCLSYVTRAVRVTDQILSSVISNRQLVLDRLVDRLDYEAELVLHPPPVSQIPYLFTTIEWFELVFTEVLLPTACVSYHELNSYKNAIFRCWG